MSGHIFLSYARKDGREHVEKLDRALTAHGFRTWRDLRDIDHTQDFTAEIEIGIEQASHVLVCVTPASKEKDGFVRREIQYGLALRKPVLPLRFVDVVPHVPIINNEWIDFFDGWDGAFGRLREILTSTPDLDESTRPLHTTFLGDPHTDYLNALYKRIVQYLNQTVFAMLPGQANLIHLKSTDTPDAVVAQQETENLVMPMVFFEQASIFSGLQKTYASFHEAIEQHDGRLLLLGSPGAGKTTTLMAFARDAVARRLEDSARPLPMLALISTWDAEKKVPMVDWLHQSIPALTRESIAREVEMGKALLLLDGLDELGSERRILDMETGLPESYDPRRRFMDIIPSRGQVIVSCRVKDYESIEEKLQLNGAVTLQPLDDRQMQNYLRTLPQLWKILENDPELREIARTPLLLSLFTFAFRDDVTHDLTTLDTAYLREKIFEIYFEKRYQHEKHKLHAQVSYTEDQLKTYLGKLAMDNIGNRFSQENIFSVLDVAAALEDNPINNFIELGIRLNILIRTGNDKFRFIHLLLRDYFAYQYAMANLQNVHLYVQWNKTADPAQILGMLGDPRAVDALLRLLRYSKYPDMRGSAAEALGKLRDNRALLLLLDTLQSDEDEWVRCCAAEALGYMGDLGAVEPLIYALQHDVWVRSRAAESLGRLRDTRAVPALCQSLLSLNELVQQKSAFALEQIGTPAALEAVRQWSEA